MVRLTNVRKQLLLLWLLCFGLLLAPNTARADRPIGPELLPASTVVCVRAHNVQDLKERFLQTAMGRITQEPDLQPLLQHLLGSTAQLWDEVRGESGVELMQLLAIPQGEICFGLVIPEEGRPAGVLIFDAGDQLPAAQKVLDHGMTLLEDRGALRTEEMIDDIKATIFDFEGRRARQLVICERDETILVCSNLEVAKDLLRRWTLGEGDSLARNDRYMAMMNSVRASRDDAVQISWFVDPITLVHGVTRDNAAAQVGLAILPALGLDGLHGFGGSVAFAVDEFDQIMHMHVLLDRPRAGVLDLLELGAGDMTPERWIPADISSYSTLYWNAAATYTKLASLYDSFQSDGAFAGLAQRRLGDPLGVNFEQELLPAFGGRVTHFNWIERPVTIASQATLVAVHLADAAAFQKTLEKIVERFQSRLGKRSLGSTNYYEIDFPRPQSADPNAPKPRPCVAIVHDCLVITDRPALMEKIITGSGDSSQSLAGALDFKLIASKAQRQAGGAKPGMITFNRPEEGLRMMYDLATSDKSREQLRSAGSDNRFFQAISDALEQNRLPPFEVLARYLAPGGGVLYDEDTGIHYTAFTLRRK